VHLIKVLKKLGKNDDDTWSSIITSGGSVQHFDWLDEHTKNVFKTAIEIDQDWVIRHGGARQKYLCQGQSLNIFFPAGATKAYLHTVHYDAWKYGCKGLYYLRTEASNRAENVAEKIERDRLKDHSEIEMDYESQDSCPSCQG
jgi:ribonucleoside-diphosphate reductase alpha chain